MEYRSYGRTRAQELGVRDRYAVLSLRVSLLRCTVLERLLARARCETSSTGWTHLAMIHEHDVFRIRVSREAVRHVIHQAVMRWCLCDMRQVVKACTMGQYPDVPRKGPRPTTISSTPNASKGPTGRSSPGPRPAPSSTAASVRSTVGGIPSWPCQTDPMIAECARASVCVLVHGPRYVQCGLTLPRKRRRKSGITWVISRS